MAKFNDIRELAQQNARWVSNSPKDWMNYLDVAARLYRYSFKDTLLIHAQRPDATACAELEVWNKKMNRWVNRGAKGIALLDDASPRAKLRYVFDIADTHLVQGGRTPILWRIDDSEHQQMILDHLADTYALTQTDSMNAALMELAQQLTAENLEEAMDGLEYEVADTFLEGLDEDNLRVRFRELMTNSIFYTLSRRCEQEPLEVLEDEDFIRIVDFNQLPVLTFLGNAVSEQCEAVLRDIGREMQKIYRKEVTEHLAKTADSLYNSSTDFSTLKRETETNITEGGKPYGTDLSPQGGLPVSEPDRTGRADEHWEVRDAAQDLSEGKQEELVSEYMYRKELEAEQQREPEKPFVQQFYVVTDLQTNPMQIEKFGDLDDAMSCYQQVPNFHLKALGVEKTPDPLPGSLDIVQCKNGIDTIVEDYKKVPGWDNPYIQNHVVALVAEALKVQDVAVAYEINDGYFHIQTSEDGYDYTLYSKDFTVMDGGIVETDEYRPVQEVMEEVLAEHGHSVSECGVISAEYLQEQSYRAETQRAEAMKEKLAAEKPAPEASISFYVAECAEFPVMGEFHDNLTLEQALEVYDKIPAERMNGIKSIGFSLEDGSIYSGMFDLMVGGEVQAEIVNHIQHYRESPLVQKAISDMKTLLEKRQASKELEERPSTRQSVREALKNRKKAQEQQSNQEQEKPKKAKKKGEMEL